jgi:hypothetical protein
MYYIVLLTGGDKRKILEHHFAHMVPTAGGPTLFALNFISA